MPDDCLFCKIVNREVPSDFLYEDDEFVVFKDINPQAPVHILIVPKKHIRSMNDIEPEDKDTVSGLFLIAKQIAKEQGINESGYKLVFNVEKGGGQMIFHIHLHLVGGWEK